MNNILKNKIQKILDDKNGQLISSYDDYKNAKTKLIWKCNNNHEFLADWNKIQQGRWCPFCSGKKISMNDIQFLAEERGGKCLSNAYIKCIDKLLWECSLGHQWLASLNSVKNQKSWCPYCNKSIGEEICRIYFEFLFKKKFPRIRPAWLINTDGVRLELDGFCDELKLAFEYNGPHHYQDNCYGDKNNIKNVTQNDEIKINTCKNKNIVLIVIPYAPTNISTRDYIKNYLLNIIPTLGLSYDNEFINYNILDSQIYEHSPLEEARSIAESKKGKCLSIEYNGIHSKLDWKCSNNHIWSSTLDSVKNQKSWCPICNDPNKMDINDIINHLSKMRDLDNDILNKKVLSKAIKHLSII